MNLVDLVRHFEEHIVAMLSNSGGRERGPGGVTGRGLNPGRMLRFVLQPARNVSEETPLCHRLAEQAVQLRGQRQSIDGRRLLLRYAADGPLLNELALESEQRREIVVPRLKSLDLGSNPEQLTEEIFDIRGQLDDEFRSILWRSSLRIGPSIQQLHVQIRIRRVKLFQEKRVQPHQSLADIKVLKPYAEA